MTPYAQKDTKYAANRGQGMFLVVGAIFIAAQKLMGIHFRAEHHNEVWWIVPGFLLLGLYMIRRHGRLLAETPDNRTDWFCLLGSLASFVVFAAQCIASTP